MKIHKQAGEKISYFLKKRGFKQEVLVKHLGINKSNISRLVHGNKVIDIEEARIISKVLDVEITINKRGIKFKDAKKLTSLSEEKETEE